MLVDVTTSSDKEFHGFTTLTAKLFLRNSSHDLCVLSFKEWPLVDVLVERFSILQ